MRHFRWVLAALAVCLTAGMARASDVPDEELIKIRTPATKIVIVAVAPRLINEGEVDTTVVKQSSSGLPIVGVGEQVYLAASAGGLDATAFDWSLTPAEGSSAAIAEAGNVGKTFTADVEGDYEVSLKITHAGGDTTMTQTITAAKYVGVDRCGQCHPGTKEAWSQTGHAKMLIRGLSGTLSGHYNAGCVKCHSVSSNTSNVTVAPSDNDGFEDVAAQIGWAFPSSLTSGTWGQSSDSKTPDALGVGAWNLDLTGSGWDDLPAELKALGNIQCENCHGPGSAHAAGGFANASGARKIGLSLDNGVCAKCHDDGHYHVRPHEWEASGHGKVWSRNSATCAPCHLGSGYVKAAEGEEVTAGSFELGVTQTCATCHNPHSVANEHQVRVAGTAEFTALVPDAGGNNSAEAVSYTTTDMGTAAQCVQCHHLRPGRNVPGTSIHHSHQGEMVQGIGGYHYDGEIYGSGSHKFMANVCTTCHMSSAPAGAAGHLGSHTWNMHWDGGTPDDPSDDIYNTVGCAQCHGPVQNFDVNGAQSEIEEMLHVLAGLLPKVDGDPTEVATYYSPSGGHGNATRELTPAEEHAGWNQRFVHDDGSEGVHNFVYARKLLATALKDMKAEAPSPLAGDFDGSGKVDFADLFMFTAKFGQSEASEGWDARYDLSGNGVVGFTDWLMFLDTFGNAAAASKPVFVNNGINAGADFVLLGSNHQGIDSEHLGVTLQAVNMTQMRGYGVYVTYDTDALEFVRGLRPDGSLIARDQAASLTVKELEPGRLLIADATVGDAAVQGTGPVADIVFRRIGIVGQSSVQIDLAQIADLNFGLNMPGAPAHEVVSAPEYALTQNFPNPFNPATTIRYSLAAPGDVKIVVFNALGQEVRTLVEHYKLAGDYSVQWDARDSAGREVASGVYVYRMEVNGFTQTQRMVLTR